MTEYQPAFLASQLPILALRSSRFHPAIPRADEKESEAGGFGPVAEIAIRSVVVSDQDDCFVVRWRFYVVVCNSTNGCFISFPVTSSLSDDGFSDVGL